MPISNPAQESTIPRRVDNGRFMLANQRYESHPYQTGAEPSYAESFRSTRIEPTHPNLLDRTRGLATLSRVQTERSRVKPRESVEWLWRSDAFQHHLNTHAGLQCADTKPSEEVGSWGLANGYWRCPVGYACDDDIITTIRTDVCRKMETQLSPSEWLLVYLLTLVYSTLHLLVRVLFANQ